MRQLRPPAWRLSLRNFDAWFSPERLVFWAAVLAAARWNKKRFQYSFGILSRRFHEVELYRIKDVVLDQPFLLRLFGLSNILVVGFDVVKPIVKIQAVRDGEKVREAFRTLVEARRDAKSVRVSEVG